MSSVSEVRSWLNGFYPGLMAVLRDEHIEAALRSSADYKEHPLARLLRAADLSGQRRDGQAGLVLANTERAVKAILQHDGAHAEHRKKWLADRVQTTCSDQDLTSVAATLGEIRAGGLLVDAGFDIEPVREAKLKTPDFKVHLGSGPLFVEVYTRNMPTDEARALQEFRDSPPPTRGPDGIGFKEHVVHPMGKPKAGETTVENAASKIAGKKPRGEQAIQGHPAILWVDLQDEDVWTLGRNDAALVWVGNDGDFFTAGLWHAFYGLKGTPMFEAHSVQERAYDAEVMMPFDGTFTQHDSWSGAVLALASLIVVFENPSARHRLPSDFFGLATQLFRFDFGLSWMEWPPGIRSLEDRVGDARVSLDALAKVVRYRW